MAKIIEEYQPYRCWGYTKKGSVPTDIRIMQNSVLTTDIGLYGSSLTSLKLLSLSNSMWLFNENLSVSKISNLDV